MLKKKDRKKKEKRKKRVKKKILAVQNKNINGGILKSIRRQIIIIQVFLFPYKIFFI